MKIVFESLKLLADIAVAVAADIAAGNVAPAPLMVVVGVVALGVPQETSPSPKRAGASSFFMGG